MPVSCPLQYQQTAILDKFGNGVSKFEQISSLFLFCAGFSDVLIDVFWSKYHRITQQSVSSFQVKAFEEKYLYCSQQVFETYYI